MRVEIIGPVTPPRDDLTQCLVRDRETGQHYLVSNLPWAPDNHEGETMVFECDDSGDPEPVNPRWVRTAGGIGMSMEQAVLDLERVLGGADPVAPEVGNNGMSPWESETWLRKLAQHESGGQSWD